jgi:hypothetical protein
MISTPSAGERMAAMRLEPLYRIRFNYPEEWEIELGGDWEQHFAIAEAAAKAASVVIFGA